ncbi:YppG family protein [Bacillus benzoevorans]|nr:YppG family protein [Bacillus benzoevorans]
MYGQMYNHYYYDGYQIMPIQPNAVPPYSQQPYPVANRQNGFHRPQVLPYVNTLPFPNYPPAPEMNPHYLQGINGFQQESIYQQQNGTQAQHVFQNPLNPSTQNAVHPQQQMGSNPYMNPYPKGSVMAKQPSGMKTVLNSFKSQDGSLDINKMVDTAGQMINAVSQVSSVVKGFGGMFKA